MEEEGKEEEKRMMMNPDVPGNNARMQVYLKAVQQRGERGLGRLIGREERGRERPTEQILSPQ